MFSNATAILWISFWEDFLQTQSMGETLFSAFNSEYFLRPCCWVLRPTLCVSDHNNKTCTIVIMFVLIWNSDDV